MRLDASTKRVAQAKKKLLKALAESRGLITVACKKVNISRITFYKYKKNDKDFAQAVEDIEAYSIDMVESKLLENIDDNKESSIFFFLKAKGRDRGYGDKIDVNVENDNKAIIEALKRKHNGSK